MSQIELRTALNAPLLPPDGAGEGRGAAGIERARAAAVDAGTLAAPREAGERALRDMPPPDRHLAGAADPGGEGFRSRVGRWFREGFMGPRAGLPETVSVNMPGGGAVAFSGRSLAGMIKSLPRLDRAAARENLAATLEARLEHGRSLLEAVQGGGELPAPDAQDVADIMLFLEARAQASGNGFAEGAFSIEDADGRLAAFLNRCPEKYQRSSSHLNDTQSAEVDGHRNTHRGIDMPGGMKGLPHGHATVLFGVIPGGEGGVPARRLFLKAESHGCRMNTLSGREHAAGRDDVPDRPKRASDLFSAIRHGLSFIQTRGKGSAAGSRKERIPDRLGHAWKSLQEGAKGDEALLALLKRGNPLSKSGGVHVMLANMREALRNPPAGHARSELAEMFRPVREALGALSELSHLESRIGNEVMFDMDELMAPPDPQAAGAAGSFDGILADAVRELAARWGLADIALTGADREAMKARIADLVFNGAGSEEGPAALTREVMERITAAVVNDHVGNLAEIAAGARPPRVDSPVSVDECFRNAGARLCENTPDFGGLIQDLALAGRACRFHAAERAAGPGGTGSTNYEADIRVGARALLEGLDDWQLRRLQANLANTGMREGLVALFTRSTAFGPDIVGTMAVNDCAGALAVADALDEAARQACADRGLEVTAPYSSSVIPAPDEFVVEVTAERVRQEARAHVDARMDAALGRLAECRGAEDADALMASLTRLRTDCLGPSPRGRELQKFEDMFHDSLARQVSAMSNRQLLDAFRGLSSTGVLHARIAADKDPAAWGASALGDLNEMEGLINMEIADRVTADASGRAADGDISAATLHVLAEADRMAAWKDLNLQSDHYLRTGEGPHLNISAGAAAALRAPGAAPLDVDTFVDTLRRSDLTINIDPDIFFGAAPSAPEVKNYFQLGIDKGIHYADRRLVTEQQQLRGVADIDRQQGVRGEYHPISAALNIGRDTLGAAGNYSVQGYVVLKDEVKQTRATFTPKDSFHAFHQEVTPERVASMSDALRDAVGGFPEPYDRVELPDALLERYAARLTELEGRSFGLRSSERFENVLNLAPEEALLDGRPLTRQEFDSLSALLDVALLKHFSSRAVADNPVATYEGMHQLLEGVDSEVIDSVRARTDDPTRINARVNNYVEAQIHGGVDLRTDVSEIHIMADMADRAVISRAREFCREHGIRLYLDALDFRQEQHEDAILVRLESMPAPGIPVDPSFDRFKSGELPDILELYRAKEMDFDPTGIHGREHVCRALIFGKALAGIYKRAGFEVDEYALYRAIAFHDSGRRSNGADMDEDKSAAKLRSYLRGEGAVDAYRDAAAGLITHGQAGQQTVEGMILQSADSLDIIRVRGLEGFNTRFLSFMQKTAVKGDAALPSDPALLRKLLEEVSRFIQMTSPPPEEVMPLDDESPEAFRARRDAATEALKARNGAIPSEGYFEERFESVLIAHKEQFPLLYENYMR